jgi:hypothetical protein
VPTLPLEPQKERSFPHPSRKKKLLKSKRESTLLLVRRQSRQAYRQYPGWMADGDREIEPLWGKLESRLAPGPKILSPPQDRPQPRRNEPRFDLRA